MNNLENQEPVEAILTKEDHDLLDLEEKVVLSQVEESRIQEETNDLILLERI